MKPFTFEDYDNATPEERQKMREAEERETERLSRAAMALMNNEIQPLYKNVKMKIRLLGT